MMPVRARAVVGDTVMVQGRPGGGGRPAAARRRWRCPGCHTIYAPAFQWLYGCAAACANSLGALNSDPHGYQNYARRLKEQAMLG